jgi:hypothetical protein
MEVCIGIYAHDRIIRPYIGDLLVVILIYCFVKSFLNISTISVAIGVLLFSYCIEILQYFHIVRLLGLENSNLARIVIGTSFAWMDIWAYTLGISLVLIIEKLLARKHNSPDKRLN